MAETYSTRQAREITDVSQRCLDYWEECGIIRASGRIAKSGTDEGGRGPARRYTYDDLLKVRVVKKLRETGLSLQRIGKALKALKRRNPNSEPLNEILMSDGRRFYRRRLDGTIEDLLADGQLVFAAIVLDRMEDEIRARISKVTASRFRPVKETVGDRRRRA